LSRRRTGNKGGTIEFAGERRLARPVYQAAVDMATRRGDKAVLAQALISFGNLLRALGEPQRVEPLHAHRDLPPRDLIAAIYEDVRRFSPQEQRDDMTLIVARCR
jgi:hypothetical protein